MNHHAYLIVGDKSASHTRALQLFELVEADLGGDPDVQILSFTTFGIDDARTIERWARQTPVARGERLFIISFSDITHETQNALLKLFEEPPGSARFALLVNRADRILPTLRSRFELVAALGDAPPVHAGATAFLKKTPGERMAYITSILAEERRHELDFFLDALEHALAQKKDVGSIRALLLARTYLNRRGASPKMLLEHLSLSVPQG